MASSSKSTGSNSPGRASALENWLRGILRSSGSEAARRAGARTAKLFRDREHKLFGSGNHQNR